MKNPDIAVAVYSEHAQAHDAIDRLSKAGFDIKNMSVVGQGYHTEETVAGFYNTEGRIKFWGRRGAVWGGLWGLFMGGLFLTVPVTGPVIVLGYIASIIVAGLEGAAIAGGLSAIGAALVGLGIPKDSVIRYEEEIRADHFMVMAHGTSDEVERARAVLAENNPNSLRVYMGPNTRHDAKAEAEEAAAS